MHVAILNEGGYQIDGTSVKLRPAMKPQKIERAETELENQLWQLRGSNPFHLKDEYISTLKNPIIQIKDMTTDQAICDGEQHTIALNFANEKHAGGGPGIYKDLKSNEIRWGRGGSAQAQEEALVNKSDLYLSLTLLPTTPEQRGNDRMMRNYYENEGFDSKAVAYISDNQLFGVQSGSFYTTRFLKEPRDVSFVTSAAVCYGKQTIIDLKEGSEPYREATQRIQTHLLAAATKAVEMKRKNPENSVELILGAFGCGAFAPKNAREYAVMIAEIYHKEIQKFHTVFFDKITFAIPKLGNTDPNSPFVRNFDAFDSVFGHDSNPD